MSLANGQCSCISSVPARARTFSTSDEGEISANRSIPSRGNAPGNARNTYYLNANPPLFAIPFPISPTSRFPRFFRSSTTTPLLPESRNVSVLSGGINVVFAVGSERIKVRSRSQNAPESVIFKVDNSTLKNRVVRINRPLRMTTNQG
jgi:hypothetical protein